MARKLTAHELCSWLVGPDWPNEGEIDIIEGVNDASNNAMTLHTSDGCSVTDDGAFTGTLGTTNCYVNAPDQSTNAGCDIQNQDTQSYGANFNRIGGGVIATEWTSSAINIWFFPRGTTPADITAGKPDPTSWKEPVAQFQGDCDIDARFQNQQIVGGHSFKSETLLLTLYARFSTLHSVATGPAMSGALAPPAPQFPLLAKIMCKTTRPRSPMHTGRSTLCRFTNPMGPLKLSHILG